ncbi:AbrB/MazE/SpoVT family DNA-binding domain-containing protein [Micromonospora sp. C32]|uniref:AbrB/MazE/SpoVT family DNA-binding domain-containing protein n=1 Tax=Micromonospora sp. C32 TaxID=2824877 RepID=UPI001B38DE16|nr:AbrB/MazE/SpoVT family DNA-binding domain-containing protein [Micromonospora sp. C32]MBQ1053440.1 AbrB/MazE/SpoVT family DNA-binding domain-containing protein [Micromonospora sp. C32]
MSREVGHAAGLAGTVGREDQPRADGRLSLAPRGLPLPSLAQGVKPQAALCAVTSVDVSGRLADRRPLQALGWFAGRTIEVIARNKSITVTARHGGQCTIGRQGHLVLPSPVRRSCGVEPGHRLLVLAYPDRSLLVAYTMTALELMLSRYAEESEAA